MPNRISPALRLVATLLLLLIAPLVARAEEDPEQKVYEQAYGEVKAAFDTTRAAFDKAYGPIKDAQEAITQWRGAVRRAQQQGAIEKIEGMVESGMTAARDEMVTQLLGEDALEALQKLEEITGTTIGLPEPKQMLDLIRDPDDFAKRYGHMYKLSQLERAFRDSRAARVLASAEAIFDKGGGYLDRAGQMVDFVSLFDPNNNAADGPVGRLRSVSAVLTTMQDMTGEIPGLGHLIGFYAEAAETFAGALDRLDARLKEARSGSLCGQLGQLQAELAALDQHIAGGTCALYMTDYPLEAALKPLKVWEHFEHGETVVWRASDGASAYLSRADRAVLETGWRALAASRDAANAGRATAGRFMSRAIVTTRAGRIVSQAQCRAAADLVASDRFRETLLALGRIDVLGVIEAPGGALIRPGRSPAAELMGLCLFDPSARNTLLDLAAQYRDVAPFRLDLVSADWQRPAAPANPSVTVNGTLLQDGVAGTRIETPSARVQGLRALADLGAPLDVSITAEGFLPKTVQLPLSRARNYAKIGLTPVPEADAAAEQARAAAEARAAETERKLAEARAAEQAARDAAKARADAARRQEEEAERLAEAAAEAARQQAANPDTPAPAPIIVPPPPDPGWPAPDVPSPDAADDQAGDTPDEAGDVQADAAQAPHAAGGAPAEPGAETPQEAGDVPSSTDGTGADSGTVQTGDDPPVSATPDPDVAVGVDPADAQPLGDPADSADPDSADPDSGQPDSAPPGDPAAPPPGSQQAAIEAVGEAAPGLGTQVPLTGIPGQVWLGDRVVISVQWVEPAPAPGSAPGACDPATPFGECEVTPHGTSGASVHISAADDTEDLAPPGPAPAATEFIWQGTEGVRFDPPTTTTPQVTARFERPGEARVWAQILRDGKTVAEGTQQVVQVGVPSISLGFDPASGAAPGAEVTARIVTTPPLDEDLFTVSWRAPATSNRLHLDGTGAAIRFSGESGEVIAFEAELVTPFWGDAIGTITGSYAMSGGAVSVTARGRGPAPQVWDPVKGGLIDAPAGRWLTGQQITLEAALEGAPEGVRWDWSVNDGTSLSNGLSRTPTVSRAEPGSIDAEVVARDRDDRELGRGTISLAVSDPPPAPPKPAPAPTPPAAATPTPAPVQPAAPPIPPAQQREQPTAPAVPQGQAPAAGAPAAGQPAAGCADTAGARSAWEDGLRAVSDGDLAAGLAALDRSLALCPDARRAAQLQTLRDRLAASAQPSPPVPAPAAPPAEATPPVAPQQAPGAAPDPCAPDQPAHAEAARAWQDGLAQIGADDHPAGLAELDRSLALCPSDVRAGQLAQLRAQLAAQPAPPAKTTAPAPATPPAPTTPPAPSGLDAAIAAAKSACEPGGDKAAQVEAEIVAADRALDAEDLGKARDALRRAQALCPDPDRAAVIAELEPVMLETPPPPPVAAEPPAEPPADPPASPEVAAAGPAERFGQGVIKLNGYGTLTGYVVSLTIADGQVSGRVEGSHDGIPMALDFAGPAERGVFDVPISGVINDPDYGDQPVAGGIDGASGPEAIVGEWHAVIDGERMQGTWRANRE